MTMKRQVFYSFYYNEDNWRAAQVRNMGILEGNSPSLDNDWETITKGGDSAIQRWIDSQMQNRSCAVLLIGSNTSGRKWINYEIKKAWESNKGLVGINIHRLLDRNSQSSMKGSNPFGNFHLNGKSMSSVVKVYDPPYLNSKDVYNYIKMNISKWIEEGIEIRRSFK